MKNIIEVIEAKLQEQKDEIWFKDVQIKDLKAQLEKANAEIAELRNSTAELRNGKTESEGAE